MMLNDIKNSIQPQPRRTVRECFEWARSVLHLSSVIPLILFSHRVVIQLKQL